MLNQFCLRMGTEPVPETLHLNELTRLKAREDYIESCRRESFKTYIFYTLSWHLALATKMRHHQATNKNSKMENSV
jgi:hypothetical protein